MQPFAVLGIPIHNEGSPTRIVLCMHTCEEHAALGLQQLGARHDPAKHAGHAGIEPAQPDPLRLNTIELHLAFW